MITETIFTVHKTVQIVIIKLLKQNTVYFTTKMEIYSTFIFMTFLIKIEIIKKKKIKNLKKKKKKKKKKNIN